MERVGDSGDAGCDDGVVESYEEHGQTEADNNSSEFETGGSSCCISFDVFLSTLTFSLTLVVSCFSLLPCCRFGEPGRCNCYDFAKLRVDVAVSLVKNALSWTYTNPF